MKVTRTALMEGVSLTFLPADKFKTSVISAQFITPIARETAAGVALIPSILRRGTLSCPDMGALSARLDTLYGARIDETVRKFGERQCFGFVASMIDDKYTPGKERLLEPVAELLGELLCEPATVRARFVPAYFETEKTNLLDAIRSTINDKREWASKRLLGEMCADEPYGVPRLGEEAEAERLRANPLYLQYRDLISTSRLELLYSGSASYERVEQALRAGFSTLPRKNLRSLAPCQPHPVREDVLHVTDSMDVTQGKLSMGFSVGSDDFPALLMGNSIFGGNSNSRLFLNVREKLSLCYYASSVYHRQKRLITVASGIEFANYQKAYDEILAQLETVQRGDLEEWEITGARSTLIHAYRSIADSQGKLENFYLGEAALDLHETPEELAEAIENVTEDRIRNAMRTVKLDTVYFLKGKEGDGSAGIGTGAAFPEES